ncbi:MAG: Y-family DNA polymerase [Pseudohongiellaceae bacterium]
MLWIALYLPELPLQLAQRAQENLAACVIADGPANRPQVRCANALARAAGIVPGMAVAAARALEARLAVLPHDEARDAEALQSLAYWAGQFTPSVALQPGEGLLLEVASTLRLHRGLKALLAHLREGSAALGYSAVPGVAPTPRAAWWLAKARHAGLPVRACLQLPLLGERLAPLPLTLLDWPPELLTTLHSLGIRSIGACCGLPRDGFLRRFGAARRLELDRALGLAADPRAWVVPPASFSSRVEFGFEVNEALRLLFPLRRLLQEFEGFLRARSSGVLQWHLQLEHSRQRRTTLALGSSLPERSAERLLALARERLAQTMLEAPVLGLGLVAGQLLEFVESSASFMANPAAQAIGWSQLVDRLLARLGSARVYRLCLHDDHRPEQAWQAGRPLPSRTASPRLPATPRPLWLLRLPRALLTEQDEPLCQGRLRLLAGPERIESGWWDGARARRDYYVARNPAGETLWIYREHHRPPRWFLHGIFG